jgi:hypothetical protein
MNKCSISNDSLKFARNVSGLLILISFLFHSIELAVIMMALLFFAAISMKLNIFYQFYFNFLGKYLKKNLAVSERDKGEVIFAWTMGGLFLLIGLVLIHFNLPTAGWIFILMDSLLMFCAGFLNLCIASIMYAALKKMLEAKKDGSGK